MEALSKPFEAGQPVRIVREPGLKYNGQRGRFLRYGTDHHGYVAINNTNPYQLPDERYYDHTTVATPALVPLASLQS